MNARRLLLLAGLLPAASRAQVPAWVRDPCAGVDCGAAAAGVGQSVVLPEIRISSAIAYALAAKSVSSSLSNRLSSNERAYGEGAGEEVDSAVKDLAVSPLGSALTKTYGGKNSDAISVAIELKSLTDGSVRAYAQEFVDPSERTLYVRLVIPRTAAEFRLGEGFRVWKGRRVRLSTQDVRVGVQNELTLWVQDADAGLTWVEQWPDGGADLMKDGRVADRFVFDRIGRRWVPAPKEGPMDPGADAAAAVSSPR
jgi:hypothetical protein